METEKVGVLDECEERVRQFQAINRELLAACEAIAAWFDGPPPMTEKNQRDHAFELVRLAIAKAKEVEPNTNGR